MRTRPAIAAAALLGILVLGVVWGRRSAGGVEVDLETIARVAVLRSFVTASGEITAVRSADIGSSVMGRLVELSVREGDMVRQGQVLAVIDPEQASSAAAGAAALVLALEAEARGASESMDVAQADLAAMRARFEEAGRALERARALHAQGIGARADLEAAAAAAEAGRAQVAAATAGLRRAEQTRDAIQQRASQARADARRARDSLAKTRIQAPIAGTVTRLDVDEGEMVVVGVQNQPGTTLMTISDLAAMEAEIRVAESDVLRLALDDPATVTLDALPGEAFRGRVVEIGASALPQAGTQVAAREFKTVVRLDDPARLRPGLTCDVEILVEERRQVLVAPLQAVVERPTAAGERRTGVFVEREGTAVFTPLTRTGIIGGLSIEVDGVPEGAQIVVGPIQVLRELADGARIRVTSRAAPRDGVE